jgi:homoserine kinase
VGLTVNAFRLRLPATSANLGAAFDTAAIAMGFYLEIEAEVASEYSILASGRNPELCSKLEDNLILQTYSSILKREGHAVSPLTVRMVNQIPLGMGCGSSAAGILAAVAMANHFAELDWSNERILAEACKLEGHPDNAAACWLGGMVVAAIEGDQIHVARVNPPADWRAMVVLPANPLATSKARAVLPKEYSRADAVANIQAASLLGLAFAQGRGDLLRPAMADRIHQPYRAEICPLLPLLLPLAGNHGILGVALSGAGPSVLLVLASEAAADEATKAVQSSLAGREQAEVLVVSFATEGAAAVREL